MFERSAFVREYLGERFARLYAQTRRGEMQEFNSYVSAARIRLVPDDELSRHDQSKHIDSYYAARPIPRPDRPRSTGEIEADVCVVGGGIAGCSTALHLAERGYRVVLLEGDRIGWGASGRSGGQAIAGFASGQDKLVAQVGPRPTRAHVGRLARSAGADARR